MLDRRMLSFSIIFTTILYFGSSLAQEPEPQVEEQESAYEEDIRRCLTTRSIRRIRIVDDRNVLIYQNSNRIFHNVLRYNCNGLKRIGTFSYNSSDGNLCEGDGIAGINGAWDDVRPMPSCWIGMHRLISREEAQALRDGGKRGPKIETRPLPMPEPEEVNTEEEDPEA